jgi:hypothetical protein
MQFNPHLANSSASPFISLSKNGFVSDAQIEEAIQLVNQLDFTDQNATLISYYGWDKDKVLATEAFYRKWLVLHKVYDQDIVLAPNKQLDDYWHFHILDTQKYMKDCDYVFGSYLHHYPYFGIGDAEAKKDLDVAFQLSRDLFMKHFGHDLIGNANRCASTSCR